VSWLSSSWQQAWRRPLARYLSLVIGLSLIALMTFSTRANAFEEHKFCWGVTLKSKSGGGVDSICNSPGGYPHLNAIYGSGAQHSVCVEGWVSGTPKCSGFGGDGVYNPLPGVFDAATIKNNGYGNNTVYAIAYYTPESSPPPPPPPPSPSWHSENMGGTFVSDPDICSWGDGGHFEIVARGTDNALWHRYWDWHVGSWSSWESLGGKLSSGPGCVSWGPNRVDIVARAADNTVLHWYWNGFWQSENLGGEISDEPDIASTEANKLDIFGRSPNGSIAHRWFNGSTWAGWETLGTSGSIVSGVSAVGSGGNRVDVVGRASNNSVYHLYYSSGWYSENFGGIAQGIPDMSTWKPGNYDVWMRGTDNGLWQKWWTGSKWSDWGFTGQYSLYSSPGANSPRSGRHDIVGLNSSGNLVHWWWE
jgi:hypothetical protein